MFNRTDKKYSNLRKTRDQIEIIVSILDMAVNGAGKTRIMYGANLNFVQLRKYLTFLMERELISHDGEDRAIYVTSEKGLKFLEKYKEFKDALLPKNGDSKIRVRQF